MHMTTAQYQKSCKSSDPQVEDIPAFFREFFPEQCAAIVDVYCEPPFSGWKEMARQEQLPLKYYFAMGCHPHNAKEYTNSTEQILLEAMQDPYSHLYPYLMKEMCCIG
jgi:TatD DNase family protein